MRTGDYRLIKNINDRLVLNLIREHGKISGAELANITGMRPSTISSILKNLQDKSLILNLGKGDSTERGGKRPYLWKLNDKAAYVVGLDVEIGEISAVILDMAGGIVAKKLFKQKLFTGHRDLIKQIVQIFEDILNHIRLDPTKVLGMGIAVAGVVRSDVGTIVSTDVLTQLNVPVLSHLEKKFTIPIIIDNNANTAALCEKWVGSAKGFKNFMTILIEVNKNVGGMGIGLVINEELYHGADFCSGELNIQLPTLDNKLSTLRNRFAEAKVLKQYTGNLEKVDISVMIHAAKKGDKIAQLYFSTLGHFIGKTISQVVAAMNPELVILAGDIAELNNIITDPVQRYIEMEVLNIKPEPLKIVTSMHGRYSVAMGAAALILNEFFKIPAINETREIQF
jgi:N-acetylglucosamine repressor